MKKIMILVLLSFLFSCQLQNPISFEEISQPYFNQYGPPEKTGEIKIIYKNSNDPRNYHEIKWYWISKKFEVRFGKYNDSIGWFVIEEII